MIKNTVVKMIAGLGKRQLIGVNGKVFHDNKEDLAYFKKVTMGKQLLVGRKTYDEVGKLAARDFIVLSRQPKPESVTDDVQWVSDISKADIRDELWVAGGAEVYQQMMPYADYLYITLHLWHMRGSENSDPSVSTYFPFWDPRDFELLDSPIKTGKAKSLAFLTYASLRYRELLKQRALDELKVLVGDV